MKTGSRKKCCIDQHLCWCGEQKSENKRVIVSYTIRAELSDPCRAGQQAHPPCNVVSLKFIDNNNTILIMPRRGGIHVGSGSQNYDAGKY